MTQMAALPDMESTSKRPSGHLVSGDGFGDWCATLDSMTPEQLADVLAFIIGKLCKR